MQRSLGARCARLVEQRLTICATDLFDKGSRLPEPGRFGRLLTSFANPLASLRTPLNTSSYPD